MLNTAITAAILAGRDILKIYNNPAADLSVERKVDSSPLTIADKAAHKIIMHHLEKTGLPIPKGNISQGRPVAGVIYVPVTEVLYVGQMGQGAWKITGAEPALTFDELTVAGQKLPTEILPDTYTVASSRSHRNPETEAYINNLEQENGEVNIITSGSSLKICLVAEGSAHEYPRFGPTMEWDTAAGHAILKAVGKNIFKIDSLEEISYNKPDLLNPYFIVK